MNKLQFIKQTLTLFIILALAFFVTPLKAQHLFSVSYNDLSRNTVKEIQSQILNSEISVLSLTKNNENRDIFPVVYSTVENARIIILNERTGNNVVITPTSKASTHFELAPFFVEELRQGVLGDADRFLVLVTSEDFSVKNVSSVSVSRNEVYIPQYFYGLKEDVKEALPKDRQIIRIHKQKPRLITIPSDDPEFESYIAQLEEEMSYYIYIYKFPNGVLCTYDEHFNPDDSPLLGRSGNNLQFQLSGNLNAQQITATNYAFNLWSEQLAGTVPIDIRVNYVSLGQGVLGSSTYMQFFFNPTTDSWYVSSLWNQLVGYDATSNRDISLSMGSGVTWYLGTNASPVGGQFDWVTIMLHEVCHGLGFSSNTNQDGSYFYITSGGGASYDDYPCILTRQLFQGTTGPCITELTQSQRAAVLTSNNLFAGAPGSYLLEANGGTRVKFYAPSSWAPGSSRCHWDTSVSFSTFMKYAASYGYALHTFNTRKIGILKDIGWTVPVGTGTCAPPIINSVENVLNGNQITWTLSEGETVNLYYNNNIIASNIAGTTFFHNNPTGTPQCYKLVVYCPTGGISIMSDEMCSSFVPVASISVSPTTGHVGVPFTLTGTVTPSNATNQTITWSVQGAGVTGATISENILYTTAAGQVTVCATIEDGLSIGNDYSKGFIITINRAQLQGSVNIEGDAVFGQTLTAHTNLSSNPIIPSLGALTYQWKRGSTNIGTNSPTYTLAQADIGSTITVSVTAVNCTSSVTSTPTTQVSKAPQTAPNAPTLANATTTSIELNPITDCEYRKDTGLWQSSPLFAELTPNNTYSFEARKIETSTHLASPPSEPKQFSTLTIGVKESDFENITVYSYSNSVYIKNESKTALKSVEITDMIGRQVYQNAISENETVITLNVANGFYNVRLISQDDNMVVVKITISR